MDPMGLKKHVHIWVTHTTWFSFFSFVYDTTAWTKGVWAGNGPCTEVQIVG